MDPSEVYSLPTIDFVGGATQDLAFHVYFHAGLKPFDLFGCHANFSIISYIDRSGTPIITKKMGVLYSAKDSVDNILSVKLTPEETVSLSGKYIYQITIQDSNGTVEIPKHGIFLIYNNINKDFIK